MNLILTGFDDSPSSTPFTWLPSLRDRLATVTNDETIPARRLRTLAAAGQLVAIMADLLPQMQRRLPWRETASQLAWLAAGLFVVMSAMQLLHSH